jgi:hypothetical protein
MDKQIVTLYQTVQLLLAKQVQNGIKSNIFFIEHAGELHNISLRR